MEITLEEIQKKFESLPEDLRWAIMGTNLDEKINTIGESHGLNIEQRGQLYLETYAVMLGYTNADKFEESVKKSINLSSEKNREIVLEINEKILKDIREKFMSSGKKKESEEQEIIVPHEDLHIGGEDIDVSNEKENIEKEIQNKKIMESVSAQKLSGSFRAPTVKTEYSLNNLSKEQEKTGTSVNENVKISTGVTIQQVGSNTKSVSPSYSVKEDPYRLKPE